VKRQPSVWYANFAGLMRAENGKWQQGGFDRLLRTSESVYEKWNYIRENPVRAGLVAHWKQWPYQKGFADET
jgi:hypothetical protein